MFGHLLKSDTARLLALLAVITLLALPVLTYPLGRDQGEFATIGRGLLEGRVPYRDLWNPKPPAVFYVYAAAMAVLGRSTEALRALDLLLVLGVGAGLFSLGRRFASRRVGLWAALVFAVFYLTESFWTLTQNDGLVLLPMVWALVGMVKAAAPGRQASGGASFPASLMAVRSAFLAGALCGVAVWFKYPFALFGLVVAASFFILRWRKTPVAARRIVSLNAAFWLPFLAFLFGGLVALAAGAVYLLALGAWDGLLESAQVTAGYTALTFNASDLVPLLQTALGFRWQQWGLLFLLAALGAFLPYPLHRIPAPLPDGEAEVSRVRARWLIVYLWLLAGLVIMLVQAKGYDYHWLPMLPPLALLAARALDGLLSLLIPFVKRWSDSKASVPGVLLALAFLLLLALNLWPRALPYLTGQQDRLAYAAGFQGGEFIASESLAVADYLRARTTPGDSLFIWGFRPEVYYLSGLNPATRFIFQFPLVADWYPAVWRQETVDTLWAALPPYVLVLQADYMPWVTGRHEDSHTLLQAYTELNNWLMFNYERDTQIGNFFLWRRKPM